MSDNKSFEQLVEDMQIGERVTAKEREDGVIAEWGGIVEQIGKGDY